MKIVFVGFLFCCVSARNLDFDLEAAAAEPRPAIIEDVAEALPLYREDSGGAASEKVEKILRPALSFKYNDEEDSTVDESKQEDQLPQSVDYYKYESEEKGKEKKEHEDTMVGETQHHQKGDDGGDHEGKFAKGGGKEHHAHHHGEHGNKGEKGYKGHHHHEKGEKGHHDKEDHKKSFAEKGGHKKDHHHEDGYHGEHDKGYGGKKGGEYAEKGEHNKGHNTKGSHSIHKKDEYEKKTEFFEEDNESGESEKHGGYSHKDSYEKGGHHKGGHKKGGHHEDHYGKKGESSKGGHHKEEKGHNHKGGHEGHHEHDSKYGKKESDSNGKKWAYKKGKGNGGGGGHGAHSHQTYVVQQPPQEEVVAEAAPVHHFDIPPQVLPLEGELKTDIKRSDDVEYTKPAKFMASPEDTFLTDYLLKRLVDATAAPVMEETQKEEEKVKLKPKKKGKKKRKIKKPKKKKVESTTEIELDLTTQASEHDASKCSLEKKEEKLEPKEDETKFVIVTDDESE